MPIIADIFGHFDDPQTGRKLPVKRFTLSTCSGIKVQVISYGAGISDVVVPDKNGISDHVILGFDSIEGYVKFSFIGSSVGRHANRIEKGKFKIGEQEFQLSINNDGNHLHGGNRGWDKYNWESYTKDDQVVFTHVSPDGDEGYPGAVMAQVMYSLSEDGALTINFQAMTTKPTPINMTNHNFFNLAGHAAGQKGLFETRMEVRADHYLPVSTSLIPTGVFEPVTNTAFNLKQSTLLEKVLTEHPDKGFDHCFCITNKQRGVLEPAIKVCHPPTGRTLEVLTTEPGVQVYTANFLPKEKGLMIGRDGISYTYQGGFCCEPENYPNAVNESHFPKGITNPGEIYKHTMVYKFGIEKQEKNPN